MINYNHRSELWEVFNRILMETPELWTLMHKYTYEMIRTGRRHYSCRTIFHRIRWHVDVTTTDESFKINNNWTPYFSRVFMWANPDQGPSCWKGDPPEEQPWGIQKPFVNDGFFRLREVDTNFDIEENLFNHFSPTTRPAA